jgi:hypothetical protein
MYARANSLIVILRTFKVLCARRSGRGEGLRGARVFLLTIKPCVFPSR